MLARALAWSLVIIAASLCFGGCLYPDPDDYTGPCRFTGRDDSDCGKCLVKECPADVDALCDGTNEGEYALKTLDSCVPDGSCSATGVDGPFAECLETCKLDCSRQY